LVALAEGIGYKNEGRSVLNVNTPGCGKKLYEKPVLRVYGDIRTMTQANVANVGNLDGKKFARMNLKTG
jgi:hypothetical protein